MKCGKRANEGVRGGREGRVALDNALTCTDIGDTIGIVTGNVFFSVGLLRALSALRVLPMVGHWEEVGDVLTTSMRYVFSLYAFSTLCLLRYLS
jgi:hypothetical protein